jgi:hypothetical protein
MTTGTKEMVADRKTENRKDLETSVVRALMEDLLAGIRNRV